MYVQKYVFAISKTQVCNITGHILNNTKSLENLKLWC